MKSKNHPNIGHALLVIQRENEILIVSKETGREIATLDIDMMDDEHGKPTKSFWLRFNPLNSALNKNMADYIA